MVSVSFLGKRSTAASLKRPARSNASAMPGSNHPRWLDTRPFFGKDSIQVL